MTQPDPASLVALRTAVDDLEAATDAPFDAGQHATRYEAVHDALVAVLADVDGG